MVKDRRTAATSESMAPSGAPSAYHPPVHRPTRARAMATLCAPADRSRRSRSCSGSRILIFLIVQLAPGSPVDRFRVPRVPPEQIEALIRLYGLDKPVLRAVRQLDHRLRPGLAARRLGLLVHRRPAGPGRHHLERIPATLLLMGSALVVTIIVCHPDRHPRRRQAVQLDGQDHHDVGDHRLRHPVVPARHLRPGTSAGSSWRPDRQLFGRVRLPALRPPEPRPDGDRRPRLPPGPARDCAGDPVDRRVLALHALLDARGHAPGLRPDGQGQGRRPAHGSSTSTRCATR